MATDETAIDYVFATAAHDGILQRRADSLAVEQTGH